MDQKPNADMEDIMEGMADDLASTRQDDNQRGGGASQDFMPQLRILIPWGGGVFILSVIVSLLFGSGGSVSPEDLASLEAKMDLFGQKLRLIEGLDNKLAQLEKQGKSFEQSVARTERSGRSLAKKIEKLNKNMEALQKKVAALAAERTARATVKKKQKPAVAGRYHKVSAGESLYRIAQKYRTTVDELLRLNGLKKNQAIYPGQKLLVAPGSR